MPEVGRFYGIIIRMSVDAGEPHHMPHFDLAWAELHQEVLLSNWQTLQQGRPPVKIEPIK